jgi:hypothetical protein
MRSAAVVSVEDQPDARGELRAAHEMREEIGMEAFAERARGELGATGETAGKRTVDTSTQLTAQEAQKVVSRRLLPRSSSAVRLIFSPSRGMSQSIARRRWRTSPR